MLRGEIVELHALVDLERGGLEGFAGGGGGADVLAAVALDAGVGVEETGPGEVFEFVGAEQKRSFFDILKVLARENPGLRFETWCTRFCGSASRATGGRTLELASRATKYFAGAMKMWMCLV